MTEAYQQLKKRADTGWEALANGSPIRIMVGVATCGRAAGGLQVIDAFEKAIAANGVEARVHRVGCIGLCYAEVLIDIIAPGKPRITYANVTPALAETFVKDYLVGGNPRPDLAIGIRGEGSLDGVPALFDIPDLKPQVRVAMRNCGTIDPSDIDQYIANGGYAGLDRCLSDMQPAEVIEEVLKSGLRG